VSPEIGALDPAADELPTLGRGREYPSIT